jgi:polyhydroxybutyrate depolymerase
MRMLCICLVAACGSSDSGPRPMMFGGDRPAVLDVPPSFDDGRDYPLILALHGFGGNGFQHQAYFGLGKLVDMDEALMIAPDGITDSSGRQFWNADSQCCDFGGKNPDDVGYLGKLVDDIIAAWPVDKKRVVIIGHSNGGYMAYRMACERPDVITAIAGLAGAASSTPSACTPGRSVNVLHIHGTADAVVPYSVAEPSVAQWTGHGGCGATLTAGAMHDLDNTLAGSETQALTAACPAGVAVELWKMEGGSHIPNFGPGFTPALWQWLKDHPRN